jgi:hypothetical protein
MLIRNAFITNSSSTSFIFFGVTFNNDPDVIFEKTIPPEERATREDYEDMHDILCEWADSLKGDIGVKLDWEDLSGQVYVKDSFYRIGSGIWELPIYHITGHVEKETEWSKKILAFCETHGIEPFAGFRDDRNQSMPSWRVAVELSE